MEQMLTSEQTAGSASHGRDESPWLTVHEAAARAKCGIKLIYREVKKGRLRAVQMGGRRELRLLASWVDEWLMACAVVP